MRQGLPGSHTAPRVGDESGSPHTGHPGLGLGREGGCPRGRPEALSPLTAQARPSLSPRACAHGGQVVLPRAAPSFLSVGPVLEEGPGSVVSSVPERVSDEGRASPARGRAQNTTFDNGTLICLMSQDRPGTNARACVTPGSHRRCPEQVFTRGHSWQARPLGPCPAQTQSGN